ncbi:MAG: hypothetical protein WC505_06955 [Patescibacteria group bacterium]
MQELQSVPRDLTEEQFDGLLWPLAEKMVQQCSTKDKGPTTREWCVYSGDNQQGLQSMHLDRQDAVDHAFMWLQRYFLTGLRGNPKIKNFDTFLQEYVKNH